MIKLKGRSVKIKRRLQARWVLRRAVKTIRGEIEILAVTMTNDSPSSLRLVSAVNTFYNRLNIPLEIVKAGSSRYDGRFAQAFVEMKDENGRLFFPNQFW